MKNKTKKFDVDIYKLVTGDEIFYKNKKHLVENITKSPNGMIQTITTNTQHLIGYNIYTKNKNKAL